jgi:hypothetical protein
VRELLRHRVRAGRSDRFGIECRNRNSEQRILARATIAVRREDEPIAR